MGDITILTAILSGACLLEQCGEKLTERQKNRLRAVKNGASAIMLCDNVAYIHTGDMYGFHIDGHDFFVSTAYIRRYLGDSYYQQIQGRDSSSGMHPELPKDGDSSEIFHKEDLTRRLSASNNAEETISAFIQILEARLSVQYARMAKPQDNDDFASIIRRLRKENKELKKSLKQANITIELLQAELDKLRLLAIADDILFDEEFRSESAASREEPAVPVRTPSSATEPEDDGAEEILLDDDIEDVVLAPSGEAEKEDKTDEQDDIAEWVTSQEPDISGTSAAETTEAEPELIEEPSVATVENGNSADSQDPETVASGQYGIFPYKDNINQMSRPEFVFNYSQVAILDDEDAFIDGVEILVLPLTTTVKHPRIFIWVAHGTDTQTFWFENSEKPLEVSCGDMTLMVDTKMAGSRFKSFVSLAQEQRDNGYHVQVKSQPFNGSKGHLYLDYNGSKIHICPVTFENNEESLANIIYCIEKDGKVVQQGDNSENSRVPIIGSNPPCVILARWVDSSLYGAVYLEDDLA